MLVCTCSWQIYVIISRVVRLSRAPLSLACASPVAEAELELRPGPLMREAAQALGYSTPVVGRRHAA